MSNVPDSCAAFEEDLSALIDAELTPDREAQVRAHLDECRACSETLESLCNVDLALASIEVPVLPADLRSRLEERIARDTDAAAARPALRLEPGLEGESAVPGAAARWSRLRWFSRPALGAALAAAAALALYLVMSADESSPPVPAVTPGVQLARPEPQRAAAPQKLEALEAVPEEDLAVVLELDTIEDLDVIANLDFLERWVALEEGTSG